MNTFLVRHEKVRQPESGRPGHERRTACSHPIGRGIKTQSVDFYSVFS